MLEELNTKIGQTLLLDCWLGWPVILKDNIQSHFSHVRLFRSPKKWMSNNKSQNSFPSYVCCVTWYPSLLFCLLQSECPWTGGKWRGHISEVCLLVVREGILRVNHSGSSKPKDSEESGLYTWWDREMKLKVHYGGSSFRDIERMGIKYQ